MDGRLIEVRLYVCYKVPKMAIDHMHNDVTRLDVREE
jgi:hypothetical protein